MKCIRCGAEIKETDIECPNCGFLASENKRYKKVKVETDVQIDDKNKIILIDNPILTFLFGLISLLLGTMNCLYGVNDQIVFLYVILFVISFSLAFVFSMKETKRKLKPVRTFGVVLAYIGLALTLYGLMMFLLNFLNL